LAVWLLQVNAKTQNRTALQVAAHEGHQDVVIVLQNAGADAKIQDEDGDTAFHYAVIGYVSRIHVDIIHLIHRRQKSTRSFFPEVYSL